MEGINKAFLLIVGLCSWLMLLPAVAGESIVFGYRACA